MADYINVNSLKTRLITLALNVSKDGIHASPEKVKAILDCLGRNPCMTSDHFGDWLVTTENLLRDFCSWQSR